AEALYRLAAKLIHRQRRDRIAWRREHSEDAQLGQCLLQDRMVAAKGREYERAGDGVAVVGKVHQKPCGTRTDQTNQNHLAIDETVKAVPEGDRVRLFVEMFRLPEVARVVLFMTGSFEKTR